MKKVFLCVTLMLLVFILCSCELAFLQQSFWCYHNWQYTGCEKQRVCSKCGASKEDVVHHQYQDTVIAPTHEAGGYTSHTCVYCGNTYITDETERLKYTSDEIYNLASVATVEIIATTKNGTDRLGTGFVVDEVGTIITNFHVVKGAYSIIIKASDGDKFTVLSIKGYSEKFDLAILQTDYRIKNHLRLKKEHIETGAVVYALGSSHGLTGTFSSGMVSTASRILDGVEYVQSTAPISKGNSGGPLIDEYCNVVGINTMCLIDGQNLNFSVSVNELSKVDCSVPLNVLEFYNATYIKEDISVDNPSVVLFVGQSLAVHIGYITNSTDKVLLVSYNPNENIAKVSWTEDGKMFITAKKEGIIKIKITSDCVCDVPDVEYVAVTVKKTPYEALKSYIISNYIGIDELGRCYVSYLASEIYTQNGNYFVLSYSYDYDYISIELINHLGFNESCSVEIVIYSFSKNSYYVELEWYGLAEGYGFITPSLVNDNYSYMAFTSFTGAQYSKSEFEAKAGSFVHDIVVLLDALLLSNVKNDYRASDFGFSIDIIK